MVSLPGGEHCRCTNEGSAPRGWHLDQRWQKRGGGKQSILLLPLVRWAGPPWFQPIDQRCSIQYSSGLCRSMSFACQLVPDVSARMSPGTSPPSHSSNPTALFDCRISYGRSRRAACNGSHVRVRTRLVVRALLARLLLSSDVVDPGTHSQNACAGQPQRARSV